VAHFVMVLARPQHLPQQQQQLEGPLWGVPAVVPSTPLEQQHFDTGRQDLMQAGVLLD
jgi:hypothetical protein